MRDRSSYQSVCAEKIHEFGCDVSTSRPGCSGPADTSPKVHKLCSLPGRPYLKAGKWAVNHGPALAPNTMKIPVGMGPQPDRYTAINVQEKLRFRWTGCTRGVYKPFQRKSFELGMFTARLSVLNSTFKSLGPSNSTFPRKELSCWQSCRCAYDAGAAWPRSAVSLPDTRGAHWLSRGLHWSWRVRFDGLRRLRPTCAGLNASSLSTLFFLNLPNGADSAHYGRVKDECYKSQAEFSSGRKGTAGKC